MFTGNVLAFVQFHVRSKITKMGPDDSVLEKGPGGPPMWTPTSDNKSLPVKVNVVAALMVRACILIKNPAIS